MNYRLIVPPSVEPVTLDEVRLHARIDGSDDDVLLDVYRAAAREACEQRIEKAILAQTRTLTLCNDDVAGLSDDIEVRWGPLQAVTGITYRDQVNGTTHDWPSDYWYTYAGSDVVPPEVELVPGASWPSVGPYEDALTITYCAGYAAQVTASAAADTVTVHGFGPYAAGAAVRFSNIGGALPAPLIAGRLYYVREVISAGVYTLAESIGGALLDLTSAGNGLNLIGSIPQALRAWILLATTWAYENRSTDFPRTFSDGLLDRFRVIGA